MNRIFEEKARSLTQKLTLKEKIGQITQGHAGWDSYEKVNGKIQLTEAFKKWVDEYGGIGALEGLIRSGSWIKKFYGNGIEIHERVMVANMVQKYIMEHARVPLPALIEVEAPHGVYALGGTVFPTGICCGCAFNPVLYEEMMAAIAKEIKLSGNHVAFVTMLDVAKDPRWGRTEECYSEDPYLSSLYAEHAVKGLKREGILSCSKHYLGAGASEAGLNCGELTLGEREIREIHLEPTRAAVNAGTDFIMVAYNAIDGVPLHANSYMLKDILRKELGYEGVIMSDGTGVNALKNVLGIDDKCAAVMAAKAGIDLSLNDLGQFKFLEKAVQEGLIEEAIVDEACIRVIYKKLEAGIIDNPYTDEDSVVEYIHSGILQKKAYEVAAESIVMLKNDGVLPLNGNEKIALIGQNAKKLHWLLGSYTAQRKPGEGADLFTALEQQFDNITYCEGWNYDESKCDYLAAINVCKDCDVILFCIGGNSQQSYEMNNNVEFHEAGGVIGSKEFIDCGECRDVSSLALPKVQIELLKRLAKLGKPIVAILVQGRPYSIKEVNDLSNAILCAWYPGQEGSHAVTDIINGKINPSGKLSVSIPVDVGCIPVNYNRRTPFSAKYVDVDEGVLFPFGYGLSYSAFRYSNLRINKLDKNRFAISVDVHNVSDITGKETVFLFIHGTESTIIRRKELKAFQKVEIAAQSTKSVTMTLDECSFKTWSTQRRNEVESGKVKVLVGGNPYHLLQGEIVVE